MTEDRWLHEMRSLRRKSRLSAAELALRLHITEHLVVQLEKGVLKPSHDLAQRWEHILLDRTIRPRHQTR